MEPEHIKSIIERVMKRLYKNIRFMKIKNISGPGFARPAEEVGSPGLPSPSSRSRPGRDWQSEYDR